jgi:ATP-binding protein involved in chromosome partitioning
MPESNKKTAAGPGQTAQQTQGAPLEGVARVIAVSSAKGGVGKSTVASNLAMALQALGGKVGYADVDIYGPSAPILFGITELPKADKERKLMYPVPAHGIKVMSMGFFLDDDAPVVWRGPMVMSATKQFLRGVDWQGLDWLVVDLPPGTGDIVLSLAQEVPLDGAIVVTTPQDVALADVTRGVAMFRKVNTPILGIVQNMAGFTCPGCGKVDHVFGERGSEGLAQALGAPVLAEIPIDIALREQADAGLPLVASNPDHPISRIYMELAARVQVAVDESRGDLYGPQPDEISHDKNNNAVRIAWSDGVETTYSLGGLRGWCPCASCQGHSGEIAFLQAEQAPELTGFEGVGRYAVRFIWADGHSTGMYSYPWLREIAEFDECR